MKKNVLVSVIIPHYNCPDKLERLLNTIDLKSDDIQVIVVDDRSDKDLEELRMVRQKYSGYWVEFYRNNNGAKGAGTPRNIGIRHAQGQWLLFADSDDYFLEGAWGIIRRICRESDADIVFFKPISLIEGTRIRSDRSNFLVEMIEEYEVSGDRSSELQLRTGFEVPWSKLMKTSFVRDNEIYFDRALIAEDILFSTKAGLLAKKIEISDEIIYCNTKGNNNSSYNNSSFYVNIRMKEALKKLIYMRKTLRRKDINLLNMTGSGYFRAAVGMNYKITDIIKWMIIFGINGFLPFEIKYIPEIGAGLIKVKMGFNSKDR